MCTFENERTVMVCDTAIGAVRRDLGQRFGERVQFTTVHGAGTLVQAAPDVEAEQFGATARAAIDAAQQESPVS